jgi:hypothetical protein
MRPLEWEQIDEYHERAKVIGGWLVKAYAEVTHNLMSEGRGMEAGFDFRVTMAFIPDPGHSWK